ncbi:MAG: ABC transporter substrate-binding protein [Bdellovibrionota bacterium]
MKKLLFKLIFGTLIVVVSSNSFVSAETSKFKVGVVIPLSGPIAEYGIAARNGIEIAQTEHPELFKNIEFIFEDNQWNAKLAVTTFNKLRSNDKVSLIYNWGNPTTEAVAPLAERYKIPLLGMSADSSVAIGKEFVTLTTNPTMAFAEKLADYLKRKNYKKLGVVLAENSYVSGIYKDLKTQLDSDQNIEIIDNYNLSETDFRSTVTKLRYRKYDALGVFLITGQVSEFYKQLADQNVKVPTFGTDFFENSTEIRMARGGMEGAVYTHLGVNDDFKAEYIKRFGNDLQLAYAGNSHDIVLMIGKLFNSGKNQSASQIMDKIRTAEEFQGACGNFIFKNTKDAGPYISFPIYTKLIKNGIVEKIF